VILLLLVTGDTTSAASFADLSHNSSGFSGFERALGLEITCGNIGGTPTLPA